MLSPAEQVAEALETGDLTDEDRRAAVKTILSKATDWRFWAKPTQLEPPGDAWHIWADVGGRGSGKTRTGAEYMIDRSLQYHRAGVKHRAGLVGRTAADVRDVMVEGDSGVMACLDRRRIKGRYEPGKRRIVIPQLEATLHTYSAMEPESLRGPQHHSLWADEPAAWRQKTDAQGNTAWSNALFGLRLDARGLIPRVIATTTPKIIPLVKEWFDALKPCVRPRGHTGVHGGFRKNDDREGPRCGLISRDVVMTTRSLYDNIAHLAPSFVAKIVERYRDSPLGAQEIFGRLVEFVEGALWDMGRIEASRVRLIPPLSRTIVAVDPPAGFAAECGIIVLGLGANPAADGHRHVYVIDDYSLHGRAEVWGAEVIKAKRKYKASLVVAENNQGGDMVRSTIQLQDSSIRYEPIHAAKSKWERAEPVASAYRRVHHVDYLPELESQMCTWTDDEEWSPDRLDALVHGVRYLLPSIIGAPVQSFSPADLTLSSVHAQRGNDYGG